MSIKNIKNPLTRRLLIIFAAPIVVPLVLIFLAFEVAITNIPEVIECFVSAWKGKTYER